MTEQQLKMLRCLIQGEIEAGLMNENGYMWAFEQEKSNDQAWETFKETFK
jgi:hypothetical protein